MLEIESGFAVCKVNMVPTVSGISLAQGRAFMWGWAPQQGFENHRDLRNTGTRPEGNFQ